MKISDQPIVVEHIFNKPINEVWGAITEHNQMINWFFDNIPDFKPEVGFKTQFNVEAPSKNFMHIWEIVEVVPERKIVYNWKYQDEKGDSIVVFELLKIDNQTKLVLTAKVLDDFDDSIPEFKRENCLGGWNYFIKDRLAAYLKD